jgi:hypothetical protein
MIRARDPEFAHQTRGIEGLLDEEVLEACDHGRHLRLERERLWRGREAARASREELVLKGLAKLRERARRRRLRHAELRGGPLKVVRRAERPEEKQAVAVEMFLRFFSHF